MTAVTSDAQIYDCRKAFAEQLIELAHEDDRIVAVCNDSVGSSNLVGFRETFPDRLVNVGIAEQASSVADRPTAASSPSSPPPPRS